jgi:hypothetical protein
VEWKYLLRQQPWIDAASQRKCRADHIHQGGVTI